LLAAVDGFLVDDLPPIAAAVNEFLNAVVNPSVYGDSSWIVAAVFACSFWFAKSATTAPWIASLLRRSEVVGLCVPGAVSAGSCSTRTAARCPCRRGSCRRPECGAGAARPDHRDDVRVGGELRRPRLAAFGRAPLVLVLELYRMVQDLAGLAVEHAVQVVDRELDPVQAVVAEVGVVAAHG